MTTNITVYSGPQNFSTIWINCRIDSQIDGSLNPEVPNTGTLNLQSISHVPDTWTLVSDNITKFSNRTTASFGGDIEFLDTTNQNTFELGSLIETQIYTKVTTTPTTITNTVSGTTFPATQTGSGTNPSIAWVQGTIDNGTTTIGTGTSVTDITSENSLRFGIIYNGIVIVSNIDVSSLPTDSGGNPIYTASDGTIYTKNAPIYSTAGRSIFRVRKKEPDVTTTTTLDVVTSENTIYDFYQVELRQASEVLNFNVRAFLLLPADIVQRSIRKQGGNLSTLGIDLGESYIRLARNFSQAQSMQTDLFDRMGINASIVPVTFKIGAEHVSLSLNQLLDVNLLGKSNNDILQYNSTSDNFESKSLSTSTITEGNKLFYTDTRVGTYLTTNSYATETYVDTAVSNLVDSAPAALDTLNELADALGDDANFSSTITNSLTNKLNISDFNSSFDTQLTTKTTSDLSEGTNLYYTDSRVDARITASNPFDGAYSSLTGAPNIPTNVSSFTNDAGYLTSVGTISYNDLTNLPTLITQSDIDTSISALVDSAPSTLDTLNELAAALGDDANFSTTITNSLATKADSSSLATVATSGSYDDLINKPTISGGGFTTGGSFTTGAGSGIATIGTGATNANKPVFYFGYNFHNSGNATTDANGNFTVTHGSSSDPERWYYVV